MALSCAMLASTRLPIPAVSVSDSFWAKVAWIENFAAPDDSLARAELTLVSEAWIVATRVDALAWVEIVAVDFWAPVVIRRVPSAEARAVMLLVEPSTRLKPLKVAFFTIVVIWSRRAVKLAFRAWRLAVSSDESAAERALAF